MLEWPKEQPAGDVAPLILDLVDRGTPVSNRVSRRQTARGGYQAHDAGYAEAPPPALAPSASPVDPIAQLKELAALNDQGILTDEEFAAQKAKILGS